MSLLGTGNGMGLDLSGFGGVLQGVAGVIGALRRPAAPPTFAPMTAFPALPAILGGAARVLPTVAGGALVARGAIAARAVVTSAVSYCKRHPAWCASIGGLAAVEGLVRGGQLPPVKRRRGRGITPRDFRAFSRVHRVLSKFCAGPARGRVRGKPRR